jgi:TRAP-type C4-dicarboxylate transport system permease small subunit
MTDQSSTDDEPPPPGAFAKTVATIGMSGIVLCIGLQVLNRYVIHVQMGWTEELARILLLWVAVAGAILAVAVDGHFRMDWITKSLHGRKKIAFRWFLSLLTVAFLLLFAYSGIRFCMEQSDEMSQMLGFSKAIPTIAIPLCGFGMALVIVVRLLFVRRTQRR